MANSNQASIICLIIINALCAVNLSHANDEIQAYSYELPNIHSRNHTFTDKQLSLKEALEFTKNNHPSIQLMAQEIAYSRGEVLVETGEFDYVIEGVLNHGQTKEVEFEASDDDDPTTIDNAFAFEFENSFFDYQVDVKKYFRGGQTASVGVAVNYEDIKDSETGAISDAEVFIELIQPLLRNRGGDVSGANEEAARIVVEARELDMRNTISESLLTTAEAYWDYVEARKLLEIRRDTAYPIENLLASLNKIIKEKNIDIDTEEAEAELYSINTDLIEAKQEYFLAKHELGLAMGLGSYKDFEIMPEPGDKFITLTDRGLDEIRNSIPVYLRKVEHQRASILSLKRLQESAIVLLNAAKRKFQPQLDLVARYGSLGRENETRISKSFSSINKNAEPSWLIGGVFSYPLGNNTAKGEHAQQRALLTDLNLRLYDSLREISSTIVILVEDLVNISKEMDLTSKSIKLYQNSLIRQKEDLLDEPDLGTLLDFISVQDDWIEAKIDLINQQSRLAKTIANLSYESGQMLEPGPEIHINTTSLTEVQ